MMKRTLSMILALVLCFGLLPVQALAEGCTCEANCADVPMESRECAYCAEGYACAKPVQESGKEDDEPAQEEAVAAVMSVDADEDSVIDGQSTGSCICNLDCSDAPNTNCSPCAVTSNNCEAPYARLAGVKLTTYDGYEYVELSSQGNVMKVSDSFDTYSLSIEALPEENKYYNNGSPSFEVWKVENGQESLVESLTSYGWTSEASFTTPGTYKIKVSLEAKGFTKVESDPFTVISGTWLTGIGGFVDWEDNPNTFTQYQDCYFNPEVEDSDQSIDITYTIKNAAGTVVDEGTVTAYGTITFKPMDAGKHTIILTGVSGGYEKSVSGEFTVSESTVEYDSATGKKITSVGFENFGGTVTNAGVGDQVSITYESEGSGKLKDAWYTLTNTKTGTVTNGYFDLLGYPDSYRASSVDVTLEEEGAYTCKVWGIDNNGYYSEASSTQSVTAAQLATLTVTPNKITEGEKVTLKATFTDPSYSEDVYVSFYEDGYSYGEVGLTTENNYEAEFEPYWGNYEVRLCDTNGKILAKQNLVVEVDTSAKMNLTVYQPTVPAGNATTLEGSIVYLPENSTATGALYVRIPGSTEFVLAQDNITFTKDEGNSVGLASWYGSYTTTSAIGEYTLELRAYIDGDKTNYLSSTQKVNTTSAPVLTSLKTNKALYREHEEVIVTAEFANMGSGWTANVGMYTEDPLPRDFLEAITSGQSVTLSGWPTGEYKLGIQFTDEYSNFVYADPITVKFGSYSYLLGAQLTSGKMAYAPGEDISVEAIVQEAGNNQNLTYTYTLAPKGQTGTPVTTSEKTYTFSTEGLALGQYTLKVELTDGDYTSTWEEGIVISDGTQADKTISIDSIDAEILEEEQKVILSAVTSGTAADIEVTFQVRKVYPDGTSGDPVAIPADMATGKAEFCPDENVKYFYKAIAYSEQAPGQFVESQEGSFDADFVSAYFSVGLDAAAYKPGQTPMITLDGAPAGCEFSFVLCDLNSTLGDELQSWTCPEEIVLTKGGRYFFTVYAWRNYGGQNRYIAASGESDEFEVQDGMYATGVAASATSVTAGQSITFNVQTAQYDEANPAQVSSVKYTIIRLNQDADYSSDVITTQTTTDTTWSWTATGAAKYMCQVVLTDSTGAKSTAYSEYFTVSAPAPAPAPADPEPEAKPNTNIGAPYTPKEEPLKVPVTGAETQTQVTATVKDETATVQAIDKKQIEQIVADKETDSVISLDLTAAETEIKQVNLPVNTLDQIAKAAAKAENDEAAFEVAMTQGSVKLDAKSLEAVVDQSKGATLQIVLEEKKAADLNEAQKEAVADMEVYGSVTAALVCVQTETRITDMKGGTVTLSVPFTVPENKVDKGFVIWGIDENGNKIQCKTWFEDGRLFWETGAFADFFITYDEDAALGMVHYTVRKGDTLAAVAQANNCSVEQILALNGDLIKDSTKIYENWDLKLPLV